LEGFQQLAIVFEFNFQALKNALREEETSLTFRDEYFHCNCDSFSIFIGTKRAIETSQWNVLKNGQVLFIYLQKRVLKIIS
jgi:hypothetical protein